MLNGRFWFSEHAIALKFNIDYQISAKHQISEQIMGGSEASPPSEIIFLNGSNERSEVVTNEVSWREQSDRSLERSEIIP